MKNSEVCECYLNDRILFNKEKNRLSATNSSISSLRRARGTCLRAPKKSEAERGGVGGWEKPNFGWQLRAFLKFFD